MTNDYLISLKKRYKLKAAEIAAMLGVSVHTVWGWSVKKDSTRFRVMPKRYLDYLELHLKCYKNPWNTKK
jgi:hypothetical protein